MDLNQWEIDVEEDVAVPPINNTNTDATNLDQVDNTNEPIEEDNTVIDDNTIGDNVDQLSKEEELVNYWIENEYVMVDPEKDEIKSMEDVLRIDAQRRTDYIKNTIIESMPDKFRLLADAVINKGISDIEPILQMMKGETKSNDELNDSRATEIVTEYFKDLGYDDDDIEMDLVSLKDKNKLLQTAQRIVAKNNQIEDSKRQIEVEQEIKRQTEQQEKIRLAEQQRYNTISTEFANKDWKKEVKQQIAEEYFEGKTFQKVRLLAENPQTAADFAMLVSRIFTIDKDNKIGIDMTSLTDLVKAKEAGKIKENWNSKLSNSKTVRFGNMQKATPKEDDLSNWSMND